MSRASGLAAAGDDAMPEPITVVGVGLGFVALTSHLARRYFETAKEVADIFIGFVALVLCLPALFVCAAIIRLSSIGPVFYRQQRVGKDGKPFMMYKFRTMRTDAELATGAVWAAHGDSRVVPACRWMRRSHVDELPQIINVIKGEMSLVGPRPERPEILNELEKAYPDVRKRLAVRPGITGLAQVRNGYDTTIEAFRTKLEADLEYIERRNWSMEFRIMAATIGKFHDRTAH
ncbi:MAG: sugar transferase [Planctomycetota bacterium]|nr:sugar transferase [Planctomycetota bacterium]